MGQSLVQQRGNAVVAGNLKKRIPIDPLCHHSERTAGARLAKIL
jgi:hypothetical protein